MIFLLKDAVTGDKISLSEQREYIVGRKNCDILLENDQSISRKHAVIRVKDDYVTLEDCKSKYHTLHNGVEVSPEVEIRLKHMDSIQFGVFNNKFSFEAYKFMTATSALSADKKLALKENVAKCNGKYVEKWCSSCTHLTVEKVTLTIKFLQALVDEKPIVTPEYWLKYSQSIENKTAPPDINKYNRPPVAEQLLRSDFQYKADSRRKTLFDNKMFVFLKSQIKNQMEEVIKSCGGDCIAWEEEGPKTFYEISTNPKEHLFVKTDSDEENVSFNAIIRDMVKQKKRTIPLNEIALAIVHCSCEINCNPSFNKVSEVFKSHTQKQQTMGILAAETETEKTVAGAFEIKTEKVIPSSVEDDWPRSVSNSKENHKKPAGPSGVKRPSADKDNAGVCKKPKTDEQENKRKEKEKLTRRENRKSEDNYVENKPQPSQKRKAEENLELSTSKKKSNPFSLITVATNKRNSIIEEENPFELTRGSNKASSSSKGPQTKYENPFSHIPSFSKSKVTIKEETKPKQEPRKQITLVANKKSDTSVVSSVKRSSLNITWMSKNTTIVKNEVKEEDSELLQIAKAFKNCVKVEVLKMYNRNEKSKDSLNNSSIDSVDGKKNFKKFKKVKPVKPQVTIIPRSRLTKITPGDVRGIEMNDLNDSDDEVVPNNVLQKSKQKVKKFVL